MLTSPPPTPAGELVATPAPVAVRASFSDRPPPVPALVGACFGLWAGTIGVRVDVLHVQVPTAFFLLGVVIALLGAITVRRSGAASQRPVALDLAMLVYLVGRFVSEFGSSHVTGHPAAYGRVASTAYVVVAYACVRLVVSDRTALRRFLGALTLPTVPVVVLGALQAADFGPAVRWVLTHTASLAASNRYTDGRLTRATSTIGHWSGLGGYLCCVVGVAFVCIALDRAAGRRLPLFQVGCLVAALLGLATTFTVAPVAVGLAVVLAGAVSSRRLLVTAAGVGAVGLIVSTVFAASISSRIALQLGGTSRVTDGGYSWVPATLVARFPIWFDEALPAWVQQPWFGWGHALYDGPENWSAVPTSIVWQSPESEYVKALVTGGVFELLLIVGLAVVWFRLVRRTAGPLGRTTRSVLTTLLVGLLLASFVNPYFTNPGLPAIWWSLLGALAWTATTNPTAAAANASAGAAASANEPVVPSVTDSPLIR